MNRKIHPSNDGVSAFGIAAVRKWGEGPALLPRRRIQPLLHYGHNERLQLIDQPLRIISRQQHSSMYGQQESLFYRTIGQTQQHVIGTEHIQNDSGLILEAQLRPRKHLQKLLPGSKATWKSKKSVCKVGHH